jgi:hypothetical protein
MSLGAQLCVLQVLMKQASLKLGNQVSAPCPMHFLFLLNFDP